MEGGRGRGGQSRERGGALSLLARPPRPRLANSGSCHSTKKTGRSRAARSSMCCQPPPLGPACEGPAARPRTHGAGARSREDSSEDASLFFFLAPPPKLTWPPTGRAGWTPGARWSRWTPGRGSRWRWRAWKRRPGRGLEGGRGAGGGGRGERVRRGGRRRRRIGGEGRGGPRRLVLLFSHAPCPGREGTDQTGAAPPESGRALGVGRGEQRRPRPPQPRRSLSFRPSRPADCSFFFFWSLVLSLPRTHRRPGRPGPPGGRAPRWRARPRGRRRRRGGRRGWPPAGARGTAAWRARGGERERGRRREERGARARMAQRGKATPHPPSLLFFFFRRARNVTTPPARSPPLPPRPPRAHAGEHRRTHPPKRKNQKRKSSHPLPHTKTKARPHPLSLPLLPFLLTPAPAAGAPP